MVRVAGGDYACDSGHVRMIWEEVGLRKEIIGGVSLISSNFFFLYPSEAPSKLTKRRSVESLRMNIFLSDFFTDSK